MRTSARICAVLFILVSAPGAATAACNVTATGVGFGPYDVFVATPLDSTGTIAVACDDSPPPDVTIAIGRSTTSGGFLPRQMRHASRPDVLNYNLFTTAARSTVWGDGTGGTSAVVAPKVKGKPHQRPAVLTVYGRIPPMQNAYVGAYSDTLTVTITW